MAKTSNTSVLKTGRKTFCAPLQHDLNSESLEKLLLCTGPIDFLKLFFSLVKDVCSAERPTFKNRLLWFEAI